MPLYFLTLFIVGIVILNIVVIECKCRCNKVAAESVISTLIVADIDNEENITCALLLEDDAKLVDGTELFDSVPEVGDTTESWVYYNISVDKWEVLGTNPQVYQDQTTLATIIVVILSFLLPIMLFFLSSPFDVT